MHGKHLENKGSKQEQRSSCQQRTFVRASGRRLFLEVLGACVPFGFKKAFPRQQGLNLNLKLLAVLASEPFPVLPGTTPSTKKKEAWTFRSRGAEGGGGSFLFFSLLLFSSRKGEAALLPFSDCFWLLLLLQVLLVPSTATKKTGDDKDVC